MKVGDKVKCIEAYAMPLTKGKIYEVLKEEVGGGICVMGDDYQDHSFVSHRFQLVTPPEDKSGTDIGVATTFQPTKSFLLAHKDEYMLLMCNGAELHIDEWNDKGYNEDLSKTEAVWGNIKTIYHLTPVWTRDTRRELTIAEAEKEFGVKIRRGDTE